MQGLRHDVVPALQGYFCFRGKKMNQGVVIRVAVDFASPEICLRSQHTTGRRGHSWKNRHQERKWCRVVIPSKCRDIAQHSGHYHIPSPIFGEQLADKFALIANICWSQAA
jgi:hypothetical protein